ncbi:hypothetical protein JCM19233_4633 [Vibrio astriarenae]|nr:hypothetical protein JCM19233_4633 [Vibrio sp. C7]
MIKIDVDSQLGSFHLNHSIELPSSGVTVLLVSLAVVKRLHCAL